MIPVSHAGLIILLSLFLILHLLILFKIIPYQLVWGGRLKSDKEMYRFEGVSILLNMLFLLVILVQSGILAIEIPKNIIIYALWVMMGLFVLNTLGNLLSKNKIERWVFTPLTILLALFSFILALSN